MTRNPLDSRVRHLLVSIFRHAVIFILTPLFFLLALSYRFLHPNRAEECGTIVRDCRSLLGLKSSTDRNELVGSKNTLSKAA
jgi:hypothetical protein